MGHRQCPSFREELNHAEAQQVAGVPRFARIVQEHSISGLVIAGDMNSSCNQTAVTKLLREGCVTPAYREPEFPTQELSSKARCHDFLPFVDAYELHPTPTMWVRDLLPVMLTNTGQLSKPLTQNLQQLFEHYADKGWMNALQQRQWITQINGAVCGVEAELAEEISGPLGLSFEQFLQLHQRIIGLGQHWSVDHSLRCHGLELSLPVTPKTYCLDRIWISSTNYVSDRCLRPFQRTSFACSSVARPCQMPGTLLIIYHWGLGLSLAVKAPVGSGGSLSHSRIRIIKKRLNC